MLYSAQNPFPTATCSLNSNLIPSLEAMKWRNGSPSRKQMFFFSYLWNFLSLDSRPYLFRIMTTEKYKSETAAARMLITIIWRKWVFRIRGHPAGEMLKCQEAGKRQEMLIDLGPLSLWPTHSSPLPTALHPPWRLGCFDRLGTVWSQGLRTCCCLSLEIICTAHFFTSFRSSLTVTFSERPSLATPPIMQALLNTHPLNTSPFPDLFSLLSVYLFIKYLYSAYYVPGLVQMLYKY